jgi:hypothetical protein
MDVCEKAGVWVVEITVRDFPMEYALSCLGQRTLVVWKPQSQ